MVRFPISIGHPSPAASTSRYRLWKSAWGKGYATEGSRALIRKGFTEFGVQRVVAQAMAVNQASRRVMEKAGLKLVRTFHQPWPYPSRATSSATWNTRWTGPDGSGRGSALVPAPG